MGLVKQEHILNFPMPNVKILLSKIKAKKQLFEFFFNYEISFL